MTTGKFHRLVIITACVLYAVTAIKSHGYYHPDEHYQIIEFAEYKLGNNTADDLAWEFHRQLRSCIQPAICFIVFKCLTGAGITDPYALALCLRLLTAVFAITAITLFIRATLTSINEKYRKLYMVLSYFLWFLPFLNVRFSSESWSGLSMLTAVALLQPNGSRGKGALIGAGIFLGLAFLFRFQTGSMIAGIALWLICIGKEKWQRLLLLLFIFLAILQVGILTDTWFYGHYTLSFLNYFIVNIVEGVASDFGTAPWYYFIEFILNASILPIGLLILISFMAGIVLQPKHIVFWAIVPFLMMHICIPHKEGRFIFPVAGFVPFIIMIALQGLDRVRSINWKNSTIIYPVYCLAGVMMLINLVALLCAAFKAPLNGNKAITSYIHEHYGNRSIHFLCDRNLHPYTPYSDLKENFYAEHNMEQVYNMRGNVHADQVNLLVIEKNTAIDPEYMKQITSLHLQKEIQSVPVWIEWLSRYYDYQRTDKVLVLYGH